MTAIDRRKLLEQSAAVKTRIRTLAASFKDNASQFPWLVELLQTQSMPVDRGILVSLAHASEPRGEEYSGTWLTRDRRFFGFLVLVSRANAALEIEDWEDVTAETVVSEHLPGMGKSFGFLALEVLSQLQG
jgi:hypothetical protein